MKRFLLGLSVWAWAVPAFAGSLLLLGAGTDSAGGPIPPTVYWSPTDIETPADFVFSNPNTVTPRTVERVAGAGNHIGRANAGIAQALGDKTFYVAVDVRNGFQCIGLANSTQALNAQLGGSGDSIGYCTTGEVNRAGSNQGSLASWTAGDVIGVRVNTTANTVQFSLNSTTVWSATYPITSLGEVAIFPAQYTQSVNGKYTADFTGLP